MLLSLVSLLLFLGWFYALKAAPSTRQPMAMPSVTVIIAALAILPITLAMHGAPRLDLGAAAWAGIVGQGLLSTTLATAAWQFGASRVGSASAGVFINIEPLMGAVFGVVLFGDRLTAALAGGGVLILLGSLAVVLGEDPAHHHDAPPTTA